MNIISLDLLIELCQTFTKLNKSSESSKTDLYIQENGLSSIMNTTKWREMIDAISADPNYNPSVKIKTFFHPEPSDFSPVWWDEVEKNGFELIEYLDINPIDEKYIGRLVDPQKTDYSEFLLAALDAKHIPYTIFNGIIRISGYIRLEPNAHEG